MKGFYLIGAKQKLKNNNGGFDEYVKHTLVQVYDLESRDDGTDYVRDPIIRSIFLKPGVLEVMKPGTPIVFELDTKMRRTNDGSEYEAIVPTNIHPASK